MAVAAYRVLANGGRLFVAAPTGIGKTISVLFPALKALGEGRPLKEWTEPAGLADMSSVGAS